MSDGFGEGSGLGTCQNGELVSQIHGSLILLIYLMRWVEISMTRSL